MTGWKLWLVWGVLCLSLLANAVALGLMLRLGQMRDLGDGSDPGNGGGWSVLPAEVRAGFRANLREHRAELAALLADLRRARAEMFAAGAARPYDRAAVEAAQERVRDASTALQARAQVMMLEAFDAAADP